MASGGNGADQVMSMVPAVPSLWTLAAMEAGCHLVCTSSAGVWSWAMAAGPCVPGQSALPPSLWLLSEECVAQSGQALWQPCPS